MFTSELRLCPSAVCVNDDSRVRLEPDSQTGFRDNKVVTEAKLFLPGEKCG